VDRGNQHLDEEAQRPNEDLSPLQNEIDQLQRNIDTLVRRTEDPDEDDENARDFRDRVKDLRREKNQRQAELREKQAANADLPPKLDRERVEQYVADVRALLNQDIPASSQALWELTDPIKIHQEPYESGKKGARWVATFSPDLMNLLTRMAAWRGNGIVQIP
jgi:predicted  nucleic acid-binding Zn-ribbon protein